MPQIATHRGATPATRVVGTDEAGYGPNLGPLVIAGTVWQTPGPAAPDSWYELLEGVVSASPSAPAESRLWWADSKAVYRSGQGLAALERGVLAALELVGERPATAREVWSLLTGNDPLGGRDEIAAAWPADFDPPLPLDPATVRPDDAALRAWRDGFTRTGIELTHIVARAVTPAEFNAACRLRETKGSVLTAETLGLVARALTNEVTEATLILCDKHGARQRYQPWLQERFPEQLVEVRREAADESRYVWGAGKNRREARFVVRAERHLPVALASMVAKYLRELAMRAFNEFWRRRVPELRPTAGYPVDARRFRQEIVAVQRALGLSDDQLWRER